MCAIAAAVLRRGWEISNWWNLQRNNIVVGISLTLQTIFPSFSKLYFSEPRSAIAAVSLRREVGRSQTGGNGGGMILGTCISHLRAIIFTKYCLLRKLSDAGCDIAGMYEIAFMWKSLQSFICGIVVGSNRN